MKGSKSLRTTFAYNCLSNKKNENNSVQLLMHVNIREIVHVLYLTYKYCQKILYKCYFSELLEKDNLNFYLLNTSFN